jgi:glycerol transport system ATP-binding protein
LLAAVTVTELSGSESYVHFDFLGQPWVALLHGIHDFAPEEQVQFFVQPEHVMLFGPDQKRITTVMQ